MSQTLGTKTLRENLSSADLLTRELIHHLESGFIPMAHGLRRTARLANDPGENEDITDLTIRSTVDKVLASDAFTQDVAAKLRNVLTSIYSDLERILGRDRL